MTGYTNELVEKNLDFPEFAKLCARSFGALVMMRDEPLDAKIVKDVEANDFYKKEITRKEKQLKKLLELKNPAEAIKFAKNEIKNKINEIEKFSDEEKERREKNAKILEKTLEKARDYNPQSEKHIEFKKFVVDQLESSLNYEIGTKNYYAGEVQYLKDSLETPIEYLANRIDTLRKEISYHKEKEEEEIKRTNERNLWINQLFESLEGL